MILLCIEGDQLALVILLMLFLVFGIPILLLIIGIAMRNKNKKTSKVLLIIAAVYSIICLGVCGSMYI